MKQLNLEDVRTALYEMNIPAVQNFAGEALKNADFRFDLEMDERKVIALMSNLEIEKHILLPVNVLENIRMKNSVNTLIYSANSHLIDLDEQ